MYFCIQTYATHFRDQTRNFSTFLQTIRSYKLIISTMLVFSSQPEWKLLAGMDENCILLVFCTRLALCHVESYTAVGKHWHLILSPAPC